jgi:carboxyl-terminal processing protease
MKIRNTAFAVTIVAVATLFAPVYGPVIRARAASTGPDDLDKDMKSVAEVFALVEKNYADPVNSEKAFYGDQGRGGAIPGMLHTLDPHSNFVDPAEYREMQRRQHAQYYGVGMQITMDQMPTEKRPKVIVMEPFVNSPAWKAGMRRGDVIVAVDGKDTTEMESAGVAELLRGPKGTLVKVTVKRESATEPFTAAITRGGIETSEVDAFWAKTGMAFVKVNTFEAQNISREVETHLQRLGEQNVQGLILDLRDNLGGLVTEAVSLAGRFLRNGQTVVSHRGRAEQEQIFRAKANPNAQKYPIVVLVNGSSASASEIVSGALQDHDRAWILGDNTFGKGLVQTVYPLVENTGLALTTAKYYTPSGRLIQRDYSNVSFFDYYYRNNTAARNSADVKSTDSGRVVYGGGGISPDEKYTPPKLDVFETELLVKYQLSNYTRHFFATHKEKLQSDWTLDKTTMDEFHNYLLDQKTEFTEADFTKDYDWIRRRLQAEIYKTAFSVDESRKYEIKTDPEVEQAIEALPKAQALLTSAHKIIVERMRK